MSHPRCVYCGHRSRDGKTTCGYHADLIELDDLSGLEDSRENFKVWWRERFTLPEITALAAFIDPTHDDRGHRASVQGNPAPADTEGF